MAHAISNGSRDQKVVALTFDDGPSSLTSSFVKKLDRRDVDGTFFVVGQNVGTNPEALRKMRAGGHAIGNHSWDHADQTGISDDAMRRSMRRTTGAIADATGGYRTHLFRPPYGSYDQSVVDGAKQLGMKTILWDVDPRDWEAGASASQIHDSIVRAARPGSIILMHDGGGDRTATLKALPRVIDTLRARGYDFETVPQLLGMRNP